MLYLVVLTAKKTHTVHSVHTDLKTAEMWAKCKTHDGEDAKVIHLGKEVAEEISDAVDNKQHKTKDAVQMAQPVIAPLSVAEVG